MTTPGEDVLRALTRLGTDADFQTVKAWIEQSHESNKNELLDTMDEIRLRWMQGKCQILEELIETLSNPRNLLLQRR